MEGVPRIKMINFPIKEIYDPVDFDILKKYISDHYDESPTDYEQEFTELQNLRKNACSPSPDITGLNAMKRYFSQLQLLRGRFPMEEGEACAISFSWEDVYQKMPVVSADVRFEEMSILFNIGSLHSRLGTREPRADSESMKVACTHFQCAAWAFQKIVELAGAHVAWTPDCEPSLLRFKSTLMLAQAQECILEKSILDHRKSAITAKVAQQLVDFYGQCLQQLALESVISVLSSRRHKEWKRTCEMKRCYYQSISYLSMGEAADEGQRYGERLAWFNAAVSSLEDAQKVGKDLKDEAVNETLRFATDVICGRQANAKKENDLIYTDRIPELQSLPEIRAASLVKGLGFEVSDKEISGQDIFRRLVPMATHAASSVYSEEKAKLLRKLTEEVEEKNAWMDDFLSSMSIATAHPVDLPMSQDLLDCCAKLRARTGVTSETDETTQTSQLTQEATSALRTLVDVSVDVESGFAELETNISEEMEAQSTFAASYPKAGPPPGESELVTVKNEAAELRSTEAEARTANAALRAALERELKNAQRLMKSPVHIIQELPSVKAVTEDEASRKILLEVARLLGVVEEMRNQRTKLIDQLRQDLLADDITQLLISGSGAAAAQGLETSEADQSEVFAQQLKKHDKVIEYLRQNMTAQGNVAKKLEEVYVQYAPIKKKLEEIERNRKEEMDELCRTFTSYTTALEKASEGVNFYERTSKTLTRLSARIQRVLSARKQMREMFIAKMAPPPQPPAPTPAAPVAVKPEDIADDGVPASEINLPPPSDGIPRLKDYLASMKPKTYGGGKKRDSQPPAAPFTVPHQGEFPTGYAQGLPSYSSGRSVTPGTATTGSSVTTSAAQEVPQSVPMDTNTQMFLPWFQDQQRWCYINQMGQAPVKYSMANQKTTISQPFLSTAENTVGYSVSFSSRVAPSITQQQTPGSQSQSQQLNQYQHIYQQYGQQPGYQPQASQAQQPYHQPTPPTTQSQQPMTQQPQASSLSKQQGYTPPQSSPASQQGYQQPSQPTNQQQQHQANQPTQPSYQQPIQQQTNQPTQPGYQQPSQSIYGQQSHQSPGYHSTQQQKTNPSNQPVQGYQQPTQPGYIQPNQQANQPSQGYQQQPQLGHVQPTQQQQANQPTPGYQQPSHPGYSQPAQPAYVQPAQQQPTNQPTQGYHQQPSQQVYTQPTQPQTNQPHRGYQQPSQPGYGQPTQPPQANQTAQQQQPGYGQPTQPPQANQTAQQQQPQQSHTDMPAHPKANQSSQQPGGLQTPACQASQTSQPGMSAYQQPTYQQAYQSQQAQQGYIQSQPTYQQAQTGQYSQQMGYPIQAAYGQQSQAGAMPQPSSPHRVSASSAQYMGLQGAYQQQGFPNRQQPNQQYSQMHQQQPPRFSSPQSYTQTSQAYQSFHTSTPTQSSQPRYSFPSSQQTHLGYSYSQQHQQSTPVSSYQNPSQTTSTFSTQQQQQPQNPSAPSQPGTNQSSVYYSTSSNSWIPPNQPPVLNGNSAIIQERKDLLSSSPVMPEITGMNSPDPAAVLTPKVLTREELEEQHAEETQLRQLAAARDASRKDPLDDNLTLNTFIAEVEKFFRRIADLERYDTGELYNAWKKICDEVRTFPKKSMAIGRMYPMKNRFPENVPFDENRVILKDAKDDYINATHVDIATLECLAESACCPKFIVAQAPLPTTLSDFWTMILEQGCEVVAMMACPAVTDVPSAVKLPPHWPESKGDVRRFGSLEVLLQALKEKEHWTERVLTVRRGGQTRTVVHLQLHNLLGAGGVRGGIPASAESLCGFVNEIRALYRQQRSPIKPITVLCGSGAGVSGTVVALYAGMLHVESTGRLPASLSTILLHLWRQKPGLVEDEEQFLLLHRALAQFANELLVKRNIVVSSGRKAPPGRQTSNPGLLKTPFSDLHTSVSALSNFEEPVAVVETKTGEEEAVPEQKQPATTSLNELAANLTDLEISPTPSQRRRITKRDFMESRQTSGGCGGLLSSNIKAEDPSDPFSDLDPMWSLKK